MNSIKEFLRELRNIINFKNIQQEVENFIQENYDER